MVIERREPGRLGYEPNVVRRTFLLGADGSQKTVSRERSSDDLLCPPHQHFRPVVLLAARHLKCGDNHNGMLKFKGQRSPIAEAYWMLALLVSLTV